MNAASKSALKLFNTETKVLNARDIVTPLVHTASGSTATAIESANIQVSSKSLSPCDTIKCNDSNQSPQVEQPNSQSPTNLAASDLYITNNFKSSLSPNHLKILPICPILPFIKDNLCKQQSLIKGNLQGKNMLASAATGSANNNSEQLSATGSTAISTTGTSSPTNSIKNINYEPFPMLSPTNDKTVNQMIMEEKSSGNNNGNGNVTTPNSNNNNTSNNNNNNNTNNNSSSSSSSSIIMDAAIRERDGTNPSSILRQNSNSSINSCSAINALSPTNGSDHSNSSISSSVPQTVDNNADVMNDLSTENTMKSKSGNNIKEEDNGSTVAEKSTNAINQAKGCNTPTLNILTTVKEEPNVLNVKKEETSMSPEMSPVGFGSIGNVVGTSVEGAARAITPVKSEPSAEVGSNSNTSDKLGSTLGTSNSCADETSSNNGPANNNGCSAGGPGSGSVGGSVGNSGVTQHSAANAFNNSGNGGPLPNCMDYAQQQNHIFVFSTQLANKGAESVLNGQFPTIIAYHCTQPATKSFLEDFFVKNPMKITKLQRQNSFNMCNIAIGAGQPWMGSCNNIPKGQQKSGAGKANFNALNTNPTNKSMLRHPNLIGFSESTDVLSSDNDLMCWEQARSSLESGSSESHAMKMLDNVESINSAQHSLGLNQHGPNKPIGAVDAGSDGGIPSLQGVKVPDENLTPQQRQHREEQLAKLKKIDQFLFPENGNEFRPDAPGNLPNANQLGKLPRDGVAGNMTGIMINMPGTGSGINPQIGNQLNPTIRNMPPNVMNQSKAPLCSTDNMAVLGDDNVGPSDIIGSHDLANMQCNPSKVPCGNNMPLSGQPCVNTSAVGTMPTNINSSSGPGSQMPCHGSGINAPTSLMPNSPEIINNFNAGGVDGPPKGMGTNIQVPDINHIGMAQMEWSKLQQQFFEERLKVGKSVTDIGGMPSSMCRSNSAGINLRPMMGGSCITSPATGGNQNMRPAQGPPPPYHPTQRSASVPIATVSPNPSSPNNPTSNLSLPSPRTSGTLGIPANSPNIDAQLSTISATTCTISTATTNTTISTTSSGISANIQSKPNFQRENSPTNGNFSNNGNINRSRGNLNQFNSNPSTPLSNMSPKDLESFNSAAPNGELKNTRPSPQRARSPLLPTNPNSISESANAEANFSASSPGLNFPPHLQNTPSNAIGNYKPTPTIERQNSAPSSTQYCRRTDNLPLNPNSNRPMPNKLSHAFDPISSLAQMSQQLTSCVSLNAGVNNNSGAMGVIGANDMNISGNVNQNMDGMMTSLDACIDHCSPNPAGNLSISPHMSGSGPFVSNNCHINSMLNPMVGQRMLNPKMCGGFNPANGGMREGAANFHGVMPTHRLMGRMPVNFSNYNVSPNIQVKASTPNTIQYMPVRPQNNNSNNIRVPPSLEFLQRYANPQLNAGSTVLDNSHGNAGGDASKMGNPNNVPGAGNPGMNFFPNCNQIGGMGVDQDDMSNNMLPTLDMNMGSPHTSLIRGMRPMRQHSLGHVGPNTGVPVSRMQAPVGGMIGSIGQQFSGASQEPLECGDSAAAMFGVGEPGQIFTGGQQKAMKNMSGLCQSMDSANAGNTGQGPNAGILTSDHNAGIQGAINGPVLLGSNNNMLNPMAGGNGPSIPCSGNNGNVNYKPFVGPASNDLKYAQQYHSFQQQLYATSTRSQQGVGNSNVGANSATNPGFFVNK